MTSIPGARIEAQFGNLTIKASNPSWLGLENDPYVTKYSTTAITILCITLDDKLIAIFGLKSTLRSKAYLVLADLAARDITYYIVSGDNSAAVLAVATLLNVVPSNILSCSLPT